MHSFNCQYFGQGGKYNFRGWGMYSKNALKFKGGKPKSRGPAKIKGAPIQLQSWVNETEEPLLKDTVV